MNLTRLLDISYLFDPTPGVNFQYLWWFMGAWILFFLIGLICFSLSYNNNYDRLLKKILKSWSNYLIYWSLIGILLTWLRDQNIPYIGMRAILFLFSAAFIIITIYKLYQNLKSIPKIRSIHLEKSEKSKYLPKKKGK